MTGLTGFLVSYALDSNYLIAHQCLWLLTVCRASLASTSSNPTMALTVDAMREYVVNKGSLGGVRVQLLACQIMENALPNGTKSQRARVVLSDGNMAAQCTAITALNDVRAGGGPRAGCAGRTARGGGAESVG